VREPGTGKVCGPIVAGPPGLGDTKTKFACIVPMVNILSDIEKLPYYERACLFLKELVMK
jgi:hypothetical protein